MMWKGPLTDLDCGTSHLVAEAGRVEPPWWYAERAYLVAGIALLLNLPHDRWPDEVSAPGALAVAGVLLALVPLVGACASFRRGRRATVLLLLAIVTLGACLSAAGRLAIRRQNPEELVWPLAYTYPLEYDR